jgi:hypothetical protein
MASIAAHIENSVTRIGVQSALGTASSNMRRLTLMGDAHPIAGAQRKTFPNTSQGQRRRLGLAPIRGPREGAQVSLPVHLRGLASVLNAAATPYAYDHASALPHQILWRALFGGELTPAAGSTVAGSSGTPVNVITVASGTPFVVGQMIVIVSGGVPYPRRVTAISTNDLTITPPLPSAPSVSDVVRNCYCYYPAERDTTVYTVDHADVEASGATTQRRAIGVHGGGEFNLPINETGSMTFSGTAVDHTDPGDLSISTDPAAELDGDPLVVTPTFYLMDTMAAAPSVVELSSFKVNLPRTWQSVAGSTINGVGSVHEVAGRDAPITVEVQGLFDSAWWTAFESSTDYTLLFFTSYGSGTAARVAGFYAGVTRLHMTPTVTDLGKLRAASFTLRCELDTTIAGAAPALNTAEIRTANLIGFRG